MTRISSKRADLAITEKDWPTLLRDDSRSGGQSPQIFKAPVGARWQLKIEGSVRSAPVLRGGLLYVTSVSGFLLAIDVVTGRLKWRFKAPASIHSTPSLSGRRVLFGCGDAKVYAVDGATGKKLWDTTAQDEVWTSPVVRNDTVYFGSADGKIYAVDAETGTPKWTKMLGGRI